VGRSVADFHLPNIAAAWVLQTAYAFGSERRMRVHSTSPTHIVLTSGSVLWTGERYLSVAAWNVPGGANVHIEAWLAGLEEINVNPSYFYGALQRRGMWEIVSAFVARLGVHAEAVFRHY